MSYSSNLILHYHNLHYLIPHYLFPSPHHIQGVNRIAEGARTVASKAKKLAGRILDVAEDVGSMTAIAKRAIVDLVEEIQGPTGTTLNSKEGENNQTVTSDSRVKS